MKNILRKISVGIFEKEIIDLDESSADKEFSKDDDGEKEVSDHFGGLFNNFRERKFSVPSKIVNKISIRNILTKKRSISESRSHAAVCEIKENQTHSDQIKNTNNKYEDVRLRNNKVRLRSYECGKANVNNSSSDVLVLCRRFSELNLPTQHNEANQLLSPIPFPLSTSNRMSRLSVANIGTYPKMSRRQKRNSLSEYGFGKVESYNKFEILGKGTYSTVFKGQSLLTKDIVALKEVKLEEAEGAPCTAIREISLLRDLRHPNIVTLHDIIYQKNYLTLVFEYLEKNLKQYMEERDNNLEMLTVKSFMHQLLSGLDFCHHRRILHRDLKPQNLLINEKHELKLADFGLARAKSIPTKTYSNEVVTLWYRPPDLLLGKTDYSGHIDIWGAGCIFVEMVNGKALFPGHTEEYQLNLIFEKLGSLSNDEWDYLELNKPRFRSHDFPHTPKPSSLLNLVSRIHYAEATQLDELLQGFLHLIGDKRLTANQALQYPYFYHGLKKLSNVSLPTCNSNSSLTSSNDGSPCESQSISNI